MSDRLVVRDAWLLDPGAGIDRRGDLHVRDGRIVAPDAGDALPGTGEEAVTEVRGSGLVVIPGLVDAHVHCYAGIGLGSPDSIGVDAAVCDVLDAGGAGAGTLEDFVATRVGPAATGVWSIANLETGGITHPSMQLNTHLALPDIETASLDELDAAIAATGGTVRALKIWAYGAMGVRWVRYGKAMASLYDLPLFVHIGEVLPTDASAISSATLDELGEGDVVTHCFTGHDGRLVGPAGLAPGVAQARERGVRFDTAQGDRNLAIQQAKAALAVGWLPDIVSTDLHMFSVAQPAVSLLHVMSGLWALGFDLADLVERASTRPAEVFGLAPRSLRTDDGAAARLSVLRTTDEPTEFQDGDRGRWTGERRLEPVGAYLDGQWHAADPATAAALDNRRPPRPGNDPPGSLDGEQRRFLTALWTALDSPTALERGWRGADLHRIVHRVRRDLGLSRPAALAAVSSALAGRDIGPVGGWLLAMAGPRTTRRCIDRALARAA